jgi:hypothetical protein
MNGKQIKNATINFLTKLINVPAFELLANKNVAGGYVGLNGSTKIDATYLPSFVDDVLEYADFASLPVTGETGKIYLTLDDNKIFRWSGSVYVEISAGGVISTLQAVLDTGNEVNTDTLIKNGSSIIQMNDSVTGVNNFVGNIGNGTNYGDATVKAGFNTRGTVENRMETIVPGVNTYFRTYPSQVQAIIDTGTFTTGFSATPNESKVFVKDSFTRQQETDFRTQGSNGSNQYYFEINTNGVDSQSSQGTFYSSKLKVYPTEFTARGVSSSTDFYEIKYNSGAGFETTTKIVNSKAYQQIDWQGIVHEQHNVIDDTYTKLEQTSAGLRYTKVVNNATVQDIYLNEQTISALQFVDDSFNTLAVSGAIGWTGCVVVFTTELKHIPYVFVNGIRYLVGISANPNDNICFFGPSDDIVRGSVNDIVSGDLLFWNPLFANSFDLTTNDVIILNYTMI